MVLTRKPSLDQIAGWLGDLAHDTVVVTSAGPPSTAEHSFLHVHRTEDYSGAPVRIEIVDLARKFGVSRIGSLNEADVVRAAAVRLLLDLPGQDLPSALAFRDKHVMKSLAAAAGIPVAQMRRVHGTSAGRRAADQIGYPVVVKPVDGGGGVGVHVLRSPAGWDAVTGTGPMLVEACVDEEAFYVVDGLTRDGAATAAVPLQMGSGALEYGQGLRPVTGFSVPASTELCQTLSAFATNVLAALPPLADETAFHMEIFQDASDELALCEVASRAGGVGHAPVFTAVTGIDQNRASLLGQLGQPRAAASGARLKEAAFVGFPRRGGLLLRHPLTLDHPGVVAYYPLARAGERCEPSRWAGDNVAWFVVETPAGEDIAGVMADAIEYYYSRTSWA